MSRAITLVLTCLLLTLSAADALAQGSREGATQFPMPADGGVRRFPAVAYEPTTDAYLVAWGYFDQNNPSTMATGARFVSPNGTPLGQPVEVIHARTAGVRAACSNNGTCLVVWVREPSSIQGRLVKNVGGTVTFAGDVFDIFVGAAPQPSAPPAVAYASGADEYLVTWTQASPVDVKGRRVSAAGAALGNTISIAATGNWEGFSSVTYNSKLNEYVVAYMWEQGVQGVGLTRVTAGTDTATSAGILYSSLFEQYPEIAYNSVADQYLAITWGANWGLSGRRADGLGNAIGIAQPLAVGGGDGIGLTYNPVANEYLAVYLRPDSEDIWGALVNASGVTINQFQVTASGTPLATKPQVAASTTTTKFLAVSSEHAHRRVMSQLVASASAPPPPPCSFTLSSSSASFGALGGSAGVTLTASASTCAWTATSDAGWVTFSNSNASGTGSKTVSFSVAANTAQSPRSATLTIGGKPYTVEQAAAVDPVIARERARSDFDGDGNYDILWHEQSVGYVATWTLDGVRLIDSLLLSHRVSDTTWQIRGTGDFNGDGKPDIVWQNTQTGWIGLWYMNGTTLIDSVYFSVERVADVNWKIVGVGDFNSDGKPDLVWQHMTQRWLAVWLLDGATVVDSVLLEPKQINDTRWEITGVADLNRDGKSDLVWRHRTNGQLAAWLMNGTTMTSSFGIGPGVVADNDWKVVGIIDANNDKKPDLLWHHVTGGWVGVWYLDGDGLIDSVSIGPGVVPVNWKVVGPR